MIALEPEAASIYCQHLPVEKLEGSNSISAFQPGSKYLVLDAGGMAEIYSIYSPTYIWCVHNLTHKIISTICNFLRWDS